MDIPFFLFFISITLSVYIYLPLFDLLGFLIFSTAGYGDHGHCILECLRMLMYHLRVRAYLRNYFDEFVMVTYKQEVINEGRIKERNKCFLLLVHAYKV